VAPHPAEQHTAEARQPPDNRHLQRRLREAPQHPRPEAVPLHQPETRDREARPHRARRNLQPRIRTAPLLEQHRILARALRIPLQTPAWHQMVGPLILGRLILECPTQARIRELRIRDRILARATPARPVRITPRRTAPVDKAKEVSDRITADGPEFRARFLLLAC
jgi:hypothetical protein